MSLYPYYTDPVFNFIMTHQLPLIHDEDISVRNYLNKYFNNLCNSLEKTIETPYDQSVYFIEAGCHETLKTKLPYIKTICSKIVSVFDLYNAGYHAEVTATVDKILNLLLPYLAVKPITKLNLQSDINTQGDILFWYRMRSGKQEKRTDLFHVPWSKRSKIGPGRYSIAGQPCLYLSSMLQVAWYEMDMPKEATYCLFIQDKNNICKVLDFTTPMYPGEFVMKMIGQYNGAWQILNGVLQPPDEDYKKYNIEKPKYYTIEEINKRIINYMMTFPLIAACSVAVNNKYQNFVEEYVFSQQVLLWVMRQKGIDGIAYRTSSKVKNAKRWNAYDIVLPADDLPIVNSDNKKYDFSPKLKKIFYLSDTIYINIADNIKKWKEQRNIIKSFADKLEITATHETYFEPYGEMISICRTFLLMFDSLANGKYESSQNIMQTLDTLNKFVKMIIQNKDNLLVKAEQKITQEININVLSTDNSNSHSDNNEGFSENTRILLKHYRQIMDCFTDKIEPVISQLTAYDNIAQMDSMPERIDKVQFQNIDDSQDQDGE